MASYKAENDKKIIYTVDNVPVYNIFITRHISDIDETLLKRHFEKFGELIELAATYGKTRRSPREYVVKYKHPESAARALMQRQHTIQRKRLSVRSCPSWEQPFNFLKNIHLFPNENYLPSALIHLEDDSIECVMQKLCLRDQLRLCICHERFEEIFKMRFLQYLSEMFNLFYLEGYANWEMREFCKLMGRRLIGLKSVGIFRRWTRRDTNILAFASQFCPNWTGLQLFGRSHVTDIFSSNINLTSITELEIVECDLYDTETIHLRNVPNLRTLGLARNSHLEGEYLCQLAGIKRLSLFSCTRLSSTNLQQICRKMKLKYLDIRLCDKIGDFTTAARHLHDCQVLRCTRHGFQYLPMFELLPNLTCLDLIYLSAPGDCLETNLSQIVATNPHMTELKLSTVNTFLSTAMCTHLAQLTNLRVLWLEGITIGEEFMPLLTALDGLDYLEELGLQSCNLTSQLAIAIIERLPQLKIFSVRYCIQLNVQFMTNLMPVLENRYMESALARQNAPLYLLIHGSHIPLKITQLPEYTNIRKYVALSNFDEFQYRGLINFNRDNTCDHHNLTDGIAYAGEPYGTFEVDDPTTDELSDLSDDTENGFNQWML